VLVKDVVADALLALAVLAVLGSALGVLVMEDVYQKLHYVALATLVAPVLVALAVLVHKGYSESTTETWLALLFVVLAAPVLTHATARAAAIRERGDWRLLAGDGAPRHEEEE
jgi:monovalent cation/proton antiporter MnhG/PhaG subunit